MKYAIEIHPQENTEKRLAYFITQSCYDRLQENLNSNNSYIELEIMDHDEMIGTGIFYLDKIIGYNVYTIDE